jgi:hypothetical protein
MSIASCGLGRDQGQLTRIFYSPRETEVILNVSHAMLYRLIAAKRLDARKLGNKTLISAESIQRLAAGLPAAKVGDAAEEEDDDENDRDDEEEFASCRRHTTPPRTPSVSRMSLHPSVIVTFQPRRARRPGATEVNPSRLVQNSALRSTSMRPKGIAGCWVMSLAMQTAGLPGEAADEPGRHRPARSPIRGDVARVHSHGPAFLARMLADWGANRLPRTELETLFRRAAEVASAHIAAAGADRWPR